MSLRENPILKSRRVRVGITIGDPSGVGPFIACKAIQKIKGLADFTVIGDSFVLKRSGASRDFLQQVKFIDLNNVNRRDFSLGTVRPEYGRASIAYLDKALELLSLNNIDCLVTCPISKEAVAAAGYKYSGHTEYLAKKAKTDFTVMMLLNRRLIFSLLTRHIPISKVSSQLDRHSICRNIELTASSLKRFFSLKNPRIAVCGLNPHASDNGLIGSEEVEIIGPAVKKAKADLMINIDGPLPADSAVRKALEGRYDALIAAYHDQALIPLKVTGYESGVNLTLGLPFIRTSPLHGTGFDIVKTPRLINENSFIEAVRLAVKCASNQKKA